MEHENDAVFIKDTATKMARVSKRIRVGINVILVVYLVMVVAAIALSVITDSGTSSGFWEKILGGLSNLLSVVVVAILLAILSKAFQDVSKSQSPFTVKQANRITTMGVLLMVNVILEAVSSLVVPISSELADVSAGFVSTPLTMNLYIDVMSLMAAIVCFCLSYLFRYGALLQWLQDETL